LLNKQDYVLFMSYLVLARKWRPKIFSEVVGQQHVLRALINGLDQNRLHHAFLFSGTRGVGKTTLARIFAKSLNCEQGVSSSPCGQCQSCTEIDAGRFVDLIEVDAASRTKVDDTRELLDNVQYAPSRGRYKVYLIDEVHMLSTSSFNALLKTLEEPPPHVKFLFATTDPQKLPVTILSRCLQFNLRRLELKQIADHLEFILGQENIPNQTQALQAIARAADGSMRDALSLLDQAIAFGGGEVTEETVSQMLGSISQEQLHNMLLALAQRDGQALLALSDELAALGRDFSRALNELLSLLQQVASCQLVPELRSEDAETSPLVIEIAEALSPETIQLLYQIALHGKRDLPLAADPQSGFNMTLLRMLSFQPVTAEIDAGFSPVKKSPAPSTNAVSAQPAEVTPPPQPASPRVANIPTENPEPLAQPVSETEPVIEAPVYTAEINADSSPQPESIEQETLLTTPTEPAPAPAVTESITEPKVAAPVEENTASQNSAAGIALQAEQWTQCISTLKLSALTRQLAENCACVNVADNKIVLSLAPELGHLATSKAKQRLQEALEQKFASEITLLIQDNGDDHDAAQTLATERAEMHTQRQIKAVAAIKNDPAVEELKKTFNARIIESSIKPLN
jgi:DNA polymerase-3 subunit gamma/tau